MEKITAPWTADQVKALNRYQTEGTFHPFTCDRNHFATLVATADGWVCPMLTRGERCDYTQRWAWAFMAEPVSA